MKTARPSPSLLFFVYLALLLLLALTALASGIPTRWLSTCISLGVAVLKALLILLFFMHLYYRPARTRVVALGSLVWLAFLLAITFGDYLTRGAIGVPGK